MKKQKKEVWMPWIWPGFNWYQGIAPTYAYTKDLPELGYKYSKLAFSYSKGVEAYYFIQSEYEGNGAKFFEYIKKNPIFLFRVLDKVNQAAESIFKFGKKYGDTDFVNLSDTQLIALHQRLFHLDNPLWRYGQIPNLLELHNNFLSQHVKLLIKKTFGKNEQDLFTIFTTSNYETITERQDRDFLDLLKKNQTTHLRNHWKKYTWMTYGWAGPALSYEYFLENYKQASKNKQTIDKIDKSTATKEATLQRQKELLSKFNTSDRQLVLLLTRIMEAKARRVDAHSLTYFLAEQMMKEIGKRVGLSLNQMRVVNPSEVPKLFKHVNVNQINEHYNRVMLWFEKGKLRLLSGEKAELKLKYISERVPKVKATKQLKGELAYPGLVRGRVRLILDIKDAINFKKGEILVTRMTDPSYVPIMKLAKAVITNVGGITCHAAIVSRELKKPCIVGTKFATEILKDGDRVEVDANKGIVRKI